MASPKETLRKVEEGVQPTSPFDVYQEPLGTLLEKLRRREISFLEAFRLIVRVTRSQVGDKELKVRRGIEEMERKIKSSSSREEKEEKS